MQDFRVSRTVIRFGSFELDAEAGELRRDGRKVRLQEQPLQILQILLQQPGNVIPREELRNRVWPSDTFVDFDHGINNAIKRLREALGDTAETPVYIETLPRRGYRFKAAVNGAPSKLQRCSVAVLPFLSLSADPDNELFADGISEEIITSLTQIRNLHVVARTSSFAFKGKAMDLRDIGRQLNVSTVLEGSVRRSGDHLRITAQLVNAADGYHFWSQRYDRQLKDMFAIQEEIAQSIAQTLELTLDAESQPLLRGGTENLDAFKLYVRGRALFFLRDQRLPTSVEYLKRAVALDPRYALAWSTLADACNMVAFYGLAHPRPWLQQGKAAAERALALDPSLAEAHNSLAVSLLFCDWDRANSEKQFVHSLKLKPQNTLARTCYGMYFLHWIAGRFEEALEQTRQAVLFDPVSAYARAMMSFAYLPLDLNKALDTAHETLSIDPDSFLGRWAQLASLNMLGRFAEAAEVGELTLRMSGRAAWVMGALARTYASSGKPELAKALYMELTWRSKHEYIAPDVLGWAAWAAGEQDAAINFEQEAVATGDPSFICAKYWPDFAELREDSRFEQILSRRGWSS